MLRRQRVLLPVLLAAAALVLAGCWDRRELNELAITVGMGFDQAGDKVRVSAQIVNPGEVTSSKQGSYTTPVTTLAATEATTFEAIRKLSSISPRQLFSSHLRVLVIGEELARQGVKTIMDGISRNYEFRSDFFIVIAKEATAEQILEVLTPIEKIPSNKLFSTLEMSARLWAPTSTMELDQFNSDLSNPAKATVLSAVQIRGDANEGERLDNVHKAHPDALLQYSGMAILKNGRLIDWLNEEESKGYNYITGKVQNSAGHIRCPDGDGVLSVEIRNASAKIKGRVADGEPKIIVDLFSEEDIAENQCKIDLTQPKNMSLLEQKLEAKLIDIIDGAIEKAKKNKADIFGFGDAIEEASPRLWLKVQNDWDSRFAKLDVDVRVNIELRRFGTTNNSLQTQKEK